MAFEHGAHCILSIVGSLSNVTLRMPQHVSDERLPLLVLDEPLEIVSAVGTFAKKDECAKSSDDINFHIHLSVSNSKGQVFGGHLIDATVRTTAEVVLGSLSGAKFTREYDPATTFGELVVQEHK